MATLDMAQEHPTLAADSDQHGALPTRVRMAYLLSRYPAVSHTFFLHEVLGLRARGMHIETASINPPDGPPAQLSAEEAAEARTTFYLKEHRGAAFAALLTMPFVHPKACARGLRALFGVRGLTLRGRLFALFYLAEAFLLGRWMRQRGLEHLHVHFGGAVATVGMLTAAAWEVPWSLTVHGPEELLDTSAYLLREKLAAASCVFAISDFCRSQLCRLLPPAQWSKVKVIRLGVDPMLLRPPVRVPEPPAGSHPLELVCVGRLVADKGQAILLQALALLQARGIRLHATLIGGGPEEPKLRELARQLGLDDIVAFTSALRHAEALSYLRHADLFALPSFAEGVPVALMEAMSLGIPCVSTAIAGIPELIRTGRDGLLVAPGNTLMLADALESLAMDPRLRRSLGASARQRVVALYNLPLNHKQLAHAFQTCTAVQAAAGAAR